MTTVSICRVVLKSRLRMAMLTVALLLSSCGDGGDENRPPTALPQTLTLTTPMSERPPGAAITLSSNAVDPEQRLRYLWQFGDGQSSTLPRPAHAYAAAGDYTVRLTLSNEAGDSRSGVGTVSISALTGVRGKLCNQPALAGWCWQSPSPLGDPMSDIAFVDALRGWAVGGPGVILATTDGGHSWQRQFPPTERWLAAVSFPSAQVGWALSNEGSVLRTVDGGSRWLLAEALDFGPSSTGSVLFAASDADQAVFSSAAGAFLTTDAGNHWRRILRPDGGTCGTRCWYVAGGPVVWASPSVAGTVNTLARSLDGGQTWTDVALTGIVFGPDQFFNLVATDAATALVSVIENSPTTFALIALWQTTDGGVTWRAIAKPPARYCDARMFDVDTLFCVGSSTVLRSTDRGASWQSFNLPTVDPLGYRVVTAQVQTYGGYITVDGGTSWRALHLAPTTRTASGEILTIRELWFFDPGEGLALDNEGQRWLTVDGGQRWARQQGNGQVLSSAAFLRGSDLVWAVSASPTRVMRSEDRGRTWLAPAATTDPPLGSVSSMHFIDADNGWLVSRSTTTGQSSVYRSTDGGRSWQLAAGTSALANLFFIAFGDRLHGVAAGTGGALLVTSDGGANWSTASLTSVSIVDLAFAGPSTVIAIDRRNIYRSSDGGLTWSAVPSPVGLEINRVRFMSATTGHIVGERGTLLKTIDGGASWSLQPTGTVQMLRSVHFTDEHTGWIGGLNGTILATITGGR